MSVQVVADYTNQAAVDVLTSNPVAVEVTVPETPEITFEAAQRGPAGPTGPKGDQGDAGLPGGSYHVHDQVAPSTLWTVNHNLGYRPTVELIDVGGNEFNARVLHVTDNHFLVYLNVATAGQARCI